MKEKIGQFKEFVGRFSRKTIALVVAGVVVLIAAAIVIAVVLNTGRIQSCSRGWVRKRRSRSLISCRKMK